MGQNAVGSAAGVGSNVPVQGPTSQNGSPSGSKGAPINEAAIQIWHKLFQSSIESPSEVGATLERAIENARELVSDLGDAVELGDLRQDILANLHCLENQIAAIKGGSDEPTAQQFASQLCDAINSIKIQTALTSSLLDKYLPVQKEG